MKIEFSPKAKLEVIAAKKYYNTQQKGLGRAFARDIKLVLTKIEANPYFAGVRYENIRAPSCKKFPFSIHYYIDSFAGTIFITSVFHNSRNPFWLPDNPYTEPE